LDIPDVALRVQNTLSGSSQGWQLLIALLRETQHFIVPQSCAFPNTEPRAAIMIRLVTEISNSLLLLWKLVLQLISGTVPDLMERTKGTRPVFLAFN